MTTPPSDVQRRALLIGISLAAALPAAVRASYQVREWPSGQAVPALQLKDLDGQTWQLDRLRGRAVLLNFWATWCEPCRAEMPSLQALARQREADGLTVLMVNYQEAEPTVRRFLEHTPIALPVLLDRDGAASRAWTPRVFPSTVLIDRTGRPRRVIVGEVDWAGPDARSWLAELLKGAPRSG